MRLIALLAVCILAAPAVALAVPGEVVLAWEAQSSNQNNFIIGHCIVPGGLHPTANSCSNFTNAWSVNWDVDHFKVGGLQAGTRHCFRVHAVNAIDASGYAPYTCVTIPAESQPLTPTNFRVLGPFEPYE